MGKPAEHDGKLRSGASKRHLIGCLQAVQLEKAGLSVASAWDEAYGSKNRKAQRNEEEGEASDDEVSCVSI